MHFIDEKFSVFENYESNVRSYCRKFPAKWDKAKGSFLIDIKGKKYLDFFCGAGSLNYGHNNEYIKKSIINYMARDGIIHSLDMFTEAKERFIRCFEEKILKQRGLDFKIMFPAPTGTNSIEAAIKLARKVKGRHNIFALMGGFHGMTLGALALTTDRYARNASGTILNNVTHIPAPYMFDFNTVQYMESLLEDDHSGVEKPAALIIETTQAEGGVYPFSNEWLKQVRDFCTRHDILLICDEIQIGCARTGDFFSFERAHIQPDIFCMAKSIGGIGLPFAITMFRPNLDVWQPGEHNGTFRGFNLAMVAAKASLEFMLENHIEDEVKRKAEFVERYIKEEIMPLDKRLLYRGIGLIWGIDFSYINDEMALACCKECFSRGLVIELAGRKDCVLKLMPPLTISNDELKEGLDIIKNAIISVLDR